MHRLLGYLLRILAAGIVLILLAACALFIAYNRGLYTGRPPAHGTLVIRGGMLFDGTGHARLENALLVIEEEHVACIGAGCRIPDGARVIEATGLSILPGLVDLHIHFGAPVEQDLNRPFLLRMWDYARQRPRYRRSFLEAGVTTIRSVGDVVGTWGDILGLKRQIISGQRTGPRIYAVGPIFTAPEGHPAGTIFRGNSFLIENATRQVTDSGAARVEVRRLVHEGVDGIKAVYDQSGGRLPRLSLEVLQAIAEEAHRHGLWVAVHTGSAQEVREAVLVGADTIEHGAARSCLLDANTIALMRSHGVTYVPTLAVLEAQLHLVETGERPGHVPLEFWQELQELIGRQGSNRLMRPAMVNVREAAAGGVRIGAGSDTQGGSMAFGTSLHRELELLVQAGLSPTEALLAATRNAAMALHADKDLGTIEPGKVADLVLVAGQPWERISDVRNIRLVIQGGQVVVDKGR